MQSKNTHEEKNAVKMCEGTLCAKCCGDCLYIDLNDSNSWGDYYCGKKRKYYPAGDSACGEFDWRR